MQPLHLIKVQASETAKIVCFVCHARQLCMMCRATVFAISEDSHWVISAQKGTKCKWYSILVRGVLGLVTRLIGLAMRQLHVGILYVHCEVVTIFESVIRHEVNAL